MSNLDPRVFSLAWGKRPWERGCTLRQNSALAKQREENSMQISLLRRWGMLWALTRDDRIQVVRIPDRKTDHVLFFQAVNKGSPTSRNYWRGYLGDILLAMNLEHPIVFDQYNICDLVRDNRLKNLKLVLRQMLCEEFNLQGSVTDRRKKAASYILQLLYW